MLCRYVIPFEGPSGWIRLGDQCSASEVPSARLITRHDAIHARSTRARKISLSSHFHTRARRDTTRVPAVVKAAGELAQIQSARRAIGLRRITARAGLKSRQRLSRELTLRRIREKILAAPREESVTRAVTTCVCSVDPEPNIAKPAAKTIASPVSIADVRIINRSCIAILWGTENVHNTRYAKLGVRVEATGVPAVVQ
jgi:hypothetical protein